MVEVNDILVVFVYIDWHAGFRNGVLMCMLSDLIESWSGLGP